MSQAIQKTLRDSAAMRWTALLLLALAMFCSYIFMDILSPIKDLMQETRGWVPYSNHLLIYKLLRCLLEHIYVLNDL